MSAKDRDVDVTGCLSCADLDLDALSAWKSYIKSGAASGDGFDAVPMGAR